MYNTVTNPEGLWSARGITHVLDRCLGEERKKPPLVSSQSVTLTSVFQRDEQRGRQLAKP
jgi:hypothetical protein